MAGTRPLRRKPTSDEAVLELQVHAEQFDKLPITNGQLITMVVADSAMGGVGRHTLGRPYKGAIIVGLTADVAPFSMFAVSETNAASRAGLDTANFVQVGTNDVTLSPHTLTLWIF